MNFKVVVTLSLVILITGVCNVFALSITGRWEASVMGHQVKAVAEQKGHEVSGVAYLYDPLGHRSTWHFNGTVNGNEVIAAHHSGHKFTGKIVANGKMSGVLEINNGFRIPLDIHAVR